MSALVIVEVREVHDAEAMKRYAEKAGATIKKYGGVYRSVRGKTEVLEGDWYPGPMVILEFPSLDRARQWYASDDYQPLIQERASAASLNLIFVEGY